MTCALIDGSGIIIAAWESAPPFDLPNGQRVGVIWPYPLPLPPFPDGSQLIPATLDADHPGKRPTCFDFASPNTKVVDGTAQIVRAWETVTPQVPPEVTNAQARYTLKLKPSKFDLAKTRFDDVNTAVYAAGNGAIVFWEYSNVIQRNGSLVHQLIAEPSVAMDDAEADALFIEAATYSF